MQRFALIVFISFISTLAFAGGPWAIGKGKGYFQPGFTYKAWDGRYEGTYANTIFRDLNRQIREANITFYGEYGFSDKLTLVTDFAYRMQSVQDEVLTASENPYQEVLPSGQLNALGNPNFALKYLLSSGALTISAQMRVSPNISQSKEEIALRSDYEAWTYTPGILVGQGLEKGYWSAEVGFAIRSNGYYESLSGNAQYGYKLNEKNFLIADVNYVISLENGVNEAGKFRQTALFIDNQGYVATGVKWYSKFHQNFSFNIAFYSGFAVINQGDQPGGLFGGIAYEM